jgi:hypothetical protein
LEQSEKDKSGLTEKHTTDMKKKDEELKTLRVKVDEARKEAVNDTRSTNKELMTAERKNMGSFLNP